MAERIGEILLKKKMLTEDQLQLALKEQAYEGGFLGHILVSKGFITERELLEVLAEQFDTKFVTLTNVQINPLIHKIIPKRLVWEHKVMPIEMRNSILLIAVSNPLNMWPLSDIQDKMKLSEVQFVLALREDILKAIEKHYGSEMAG